MTPLLRAVLRRDYEAMLVYADWLEERGDRSADGWRQIAKRRLWPYRMPRQWAWLNRPEWPDFMNDHALPRAVFRRLEGSQDGWWLTSSRQRAIEAAARAFAPP